MPQSYKSNGLALGKWVNEQRSIAAGKRVGNLSQECIDLLNQLGFVWKATKKTSVKKATKKTSEKKATKKTSSVKKATKKTSVKKTTKKTSVKKATKKAKEQLFHLRSQRTGLKQTSSLKKASRSRM